MKYFISLFLVLLSINITSDAQVHEAPAKDSGINYSYTKVHYWKVTEFYTDSIIKKLSFRKKLENYFDYVVTQKADSVNKEIDWIMSYARANEKTERYFLTFFLGRYFNSKAAWEDEVFIHLYQKNLSQSTYSWMPKDEIKAYSDWVIRLMANTPGKPAADIESTDTSGKKINLYSIKAPYTLVAIWDPLCDHCKEVLPVINKLYNTKWKNKGLKIFALSMETQGNKGNWLNFIKEKKLNNWTNVYYSSADDSVRYANGKPGYAELYNVSIFPSLYLLDKDKKIIAKNVTPEQVDEILRRRK